MKYHDWHLSGYSIHEAGSRIVLHLTWDYPDQARTENHIQFSDVAAYNFTHGMGSIITDIVEEPLSAFFRNETPFIQNTAKQFGLRYYDKDLTAYSEFIQKEGFRYWTIGSAMGFEGFVVARSIEEIAEQTN